MVSGRGKEVMKTGSEWKGWIVEENLGKGSFGQVYKITRNDFGYTYESALKVIRIPHDELEVDSLKKQGMSKEEVESYFYSMVQDISSELALMSQLRGHSNIVSYEDHMVEKLQDQFGWEIYLRMELLTPLYKYLAEHALTAAGVVRLGIDLAGALEACESNNIIHRDIKPDNIFYSRQNTFKLGDFGIAKKLEKAEYGLSKKGTFTYMAPEVYQGKSYDHTADIYSLGLVLYRFLNGNKGPFQPDRVFPMVYTEAEEATIRRMSGEVLPVPENGSEQLTEIVLKACAYRPEDRYQSAAELKRDLMDVLESQDDTAPVMPLFPTDSGTRTMFGSFEESELSKPDHDNRSKSPAPGKNSRKYLIWLTAAAAAVLLCFLLLFSEVPDVTGLSFDDAEKEISSAGLRIEESGRAFSYDVERGHVVSQTSEGKRLRRGETVYVTISRGKAINAPDFAGKKVSAARGEAKQIRLAVETESSEYSDTVKKGCVISQDPAAGTECEEGQVIKVVKSRGPEQVSVPETSGLSEDKAKKKLDEAGLKAAVSYGYSSAVSSGKVISQDHTSGSKVDKGSTVAIVVSKGPSYSRSKSSGSSKKKKSSSKKSTSSKHGKGMKL